MMEAINEETEDKEMANQAMMSSSTTQLAAKLKKLMQMESINVPMQIETIKLKADNLKKQACTLTPHASLATTSKAQGSTTSTPEMKNIRNDKTPL